MYNNSGNCKGMVYVVKEGDTLYKIAREYDLKLIDVLKANPYVNVYNLQIGDELCLPTLPNRGFQGNIPGFVPEMYVQNDNMNSNVPRRDEQGNDMNRNDQEWNDQRQDAQGNDMDRNDRDLDDRNRNDQDRNHQGGNDQNMQIYEIREGDTLADLLNYFQTDYDDLLTWNPGLRDLPIPLGVVVRFPQS